MASEVMKEFLARLGFQVDENGMQKFNNSLASASIRAAAFGATIQAAAAAAYAGVYKIAETQSNLLTMSESTGVAVSRLEELQFIALQTGSTLDALNSSVKALRANQAASIIGKGSLEAFQRLGIQVKESNGALKDTDKLLFEVGAKIKDMDRGRQEMFLNQLGIDRTLVKLLTSDIGGLQMAYQEMYAAAGVDAQQAAKDSREFVNTINMVKTALQLLAKSVAMGFMKKMRENMEGMRRMLIDNFAKISNILQTILDVILRVASFFGSLTARIGQFVGSIVDWFSKLDDGTQTMILGVIGFAAAWRYLNLAFLATPIGMIISGLIAIVALIDDFMTFMEGGQSFIDWGPWAGQIMEVVDALQPLLAALSSLWEMVKGPLLTAFEVFFQIVIGWLKAMISYFAGVVTAIARVSKGDFGGAWDAFKSGIGFGEDQGTPLAPSPQFAMATAGATNSTSSNMEANTNIIIEGSGSPEATAQAVGKRQQNVNADLVRQMRGAAR